MTTPVNPNEVRLTVDGVEVTVPKGTMVIEAAKQAGVLIPHYCYHPSLPSPAVCRMCLVEIEKVPKVVPACVTPVSEGQVVNVHSPKAESARATVLEFLLINHPLDCPICDKSGECELQDFTFQEGKAAGRFADYPKRYNPVEDFGRDILYVPNRCILCTRCVRFMEDVAETPVLTIAERGDRAYVALEQDQRLDHEWAGNVVDLCPVGSLLSKDFLNKARVWDLDKTPSICTGCTQGCNISIDTRDETVVRIRPRPNLEVNRHFICDTGRLDYRWMNRGDRAEVPQVREAGSLTVAEWPIALKRLGSLAESASKVTILAGGRISTETLGWATKLLGNSEITATIAVPLAEEVPLAAVPNLALRAERAANLHGGLLLGFTSEWQVALAAAATSDLVLLLDVDLTDQEAEQLNQSSTIVHLTTVPDPRLSRVELILPITSMAEEQGVYLNRDNRAQRFLPARSAPGQARPGWWALSQAWALQDNARIAPATASQAFGALEPFAGLSHRDLGYNGLIIAPAATEVA